MTDLPIMKKLKGFKPIWPDKAFLKQVFKLVLPIILGQIVISAVNFVDNFIVGHTTDSEVNLAAVAMANEIWYFCASFVFAIAIGSSIFMAQYFGAKKVDIFKLLQKNMMGISIIFAIIFTIIANTIPEKLMGIYSSDKAVQESGAKFLRWVIADQIFMAMSYSLQTTFNIIGKTRYILISATFALVNNSVMGWALIYPADLGTEGAGIANFVSRFSEMMIMFFFAYRNKQFISVKLNIFKYDLKLLRLVLTKWFFMLAYVVFVFSMSALSAVWSQSYHNDVTAAVGIGYAVSNIMWTIFPAISAASKNLIGINLGNSDFEKALRNSRRLNIALIAVAFTFSMIAIALSFFLPEVVGLKGQSAIYARNMILIFAGSNVLYVLSATLFAAVEAGGITLPSTICYNFFQLVIPLPIAFLLAKFAGLDFTTVFAITQALQIIPAGISYYFYRKFNWLRNIATN